MRATPTSIADVLIIEPEVFGDARGFFYEAFNQRDFDTVTGKNIRFVQDNHSRSQKNVLRGLHYQIRQTQGKLVRAVAGEIFDVAVDLRRSSTSFGKWAGAILSAENKRQLWVPEGFAHGFLVLSEIAEVIYKTTDFHAPTHERSIRWDDAQLAIDWPLAPAAAPILSPKDEAGVSFAQADLFD